MYRVNTVTLRGLSGSTYDFEIHNIDTPFNPIGAVYSFATTPYISTLYYVGMTGDLSVRFDNHHKLPQALRLGANSILVRPVPSEMERIKIEADIIAYYKPQLNETLR